MSRRVGHLLLVLVTVGLAVGGGAVALPAAGAQVEQTARATGYEVSYPQCGSTLPTEAMTSGRPAYYVNTDSAGCAFDYGWNAAKDSLGRARAAARSSGVRNVGVYSTIHPGSGSGSSPGRVSTPTTAAERRPSDQAAGIGPPGQLVPVGQLQLAQHC